MYRYDIALTDSYQLQLNAQGYWPYLITLYVSCIAPNIQRTGKSACASNICLRPPISRTSLTITPMSHGNASSTQKGQSAPGKHPINCPSHLRTAPCLRRDRGAGGAARQAAALRAEGVEVGRDAMGQYKIDLATHGWFPNRLPSDQGEDETSSDDDGGDDDDDDNANQ